MALGLAALGLACVQTACGVHPARPAARSTAVTGTPRPVSPSPVVATSPASTPLPSAAGCSNLGVISAWPLARRAALVVVAPVLNFTMAGVQAAAGAGAGGILFLGGNPPPPGLAAQLQAAFASAGAPRAPLVMADEEGGGVQRLQGAVASFPWARTMAQTMSPAQVNLQALEVGRQMRQLGVDVDLAPVLDLDAGSGPSATDADGERSFSVEPSVATRYGVDFARGLQAAGVMPVVKHFPGLGGASTNTDYGPATTQPLATLQTGGLVPFRAAIAANLPAVMVSNAAIPGLSTLPASLSAPAITGLLRQALGFQGLVLTDSLSAGAVTQSGYSLPQAAVAAVGAGADMILFGSTLTPAQTLLLSPANVATSISQIVAALVGAVTSGSLPAARLDAAVEHILAARQVDLCTH